MGGVMPSKSLIQFSVDGRGSVASLLFGLRPNYGGGDEDNGDSFKKSHVCPAALSVQDPAAVHPADPRLCQRLLDTHSKSRSVSCGVTALSPGFWCPHGFVLPSKGLLSRSCGGSVIKSHLPLKSSSLWVLSPFARSPGWEICFGP